MRGLIAVAVLCAGCHGPLEVENDDRRADAPAWLADHDLAERTTAAADVAARLWGGGPSDLDGWIIRYVPDAVEQTSGPGRYSVTLGKTYRPSLESLLGGGAVVLWVGNGDRPCLETTALAHEVGHVLIDDTNHADPRWRDNVFWARMREALNAAVPEYDTACRDQLALDYGMWH